LLSAIFNATIVIIGAVSAILGIASYINAQLVKHDAQFKLQQYSSDLEDIYKMASSAIWEAEIASSGHDLMKACLTNIRLTTAKYINARPNSLVIEDDMLTQLIEKKIVWSSSSIDNIEQSDNIVEIWLVTPDLEPRFIWTIHWPA